MHSAGLRARADCLRSGRKAHQRWRNDTAECNESTFLLTSIDMPVVSQVTKASREEPILALMLKLEMPDGGARFLSQEEFHVPEQFSGTRGHGRGQELGRIA